MGLLDKLKPAVRSAIKIFDEKITFTRTDGTHYDPEQPFSGPVDASTTVNASPGLDVVIKQEDGDRVSARKYVVAVEEFEGSTFAAPRVDDYVVVDGRSRLIIKTKLSGGLAWTVWVEA